MTDLVTGEAVVLELRLAKLATRALALAIDVAVQVAATLVGVFLVARLAPALDEAFLRALSLLGVVAIYVGYPVAAETLTRGRTLGKLALGLRAVRDDGGPVRFRHALMRGLVGFFEFYVTSGAAALVSSLVSSRGKRLGDLLAGTVVVRERVPERAAPVAAMPPALAGWAAGLELSRLPDDLALAARQYLSRLPELAPGAREAMGASLAGAVASHVTPPPPPGVPPVPYLAAVLAERRGRELARLRGAPGYPGPPAPRGAPAAYPLPPQARPAPPPGGYAQPVPRGAMHAGPAAYRTEDTRLAPPPGGPDAEPPAVTGQDPRAGAGEAPRGPFAPPA